MTALYRAGRQSDALDAYRHARLTLIERSGVEPSPALTAIHRQILAQDTGLLIPPVITGDPADQLESALVAGADALHDDGDLLASREQFETAYGLAARAGDHTGMA